MGQRPRDVSSRHQIARPGAAKTPRAASSASPLFAVIVHSGNVPWRKQPDKTHEYCAQPGMMIAGRGCSGPSQYQRW